ncbi:MAG TPA: PAS domain-containing sensor histidine kinase [Planctomycetaceae bacterium]|nr:PAS domain-containing sensor histidine kinase [Planctomycetaceae bacterium]
MLAGYAYLTPLNALIAVHVPADVVDTHIQQMAAPWTYGMLLVIGFLLPLAFGLLHYSYYSAERATQRALSALRESEERFRTLVEILPNGVQRNDLSGRITFSNPAHSRMHGYEPEELIGRYIWDFKPTAEERAALIEEFQYLVRAQPEPKPIRSRDLTRDGRIIVVRVDWTYERDSSGQVTGFVSVVSDITQQVEAEASLREFANRLQTLSRKLLAAQETERRRIATDLHDQIGQSLTALKMNLQTLRRSVGNGDESEAWAVCLRTLDDTIQEVRDLSRALRPSVLDDLGLIPAIQWLLQSQIKQSGLTTQLHTNLADVRLPPHIETAAFRIVQEALNNCVRHARANRLDVSVHRSAETLTLQIEDDGAGFDVPRALQRANRGDSLGLLGMQERAVLLDGDLRIESALGQGTRIRATIPIRAVPEEQ